MCKRIRRTLINQLICHSVNCHAIREYYNELLIINYYESALPKDMLYSQVLFAL